MAAQHAATSPLLETSIQGAKRLLVNVTAGPDFSIGEAHEAMEYILQFTDAEDADIIMGHVMRDSVDGEVQVTLLAAGMDNSAPTVRTERENSEVFDRPSNPVHVYPTPNPAPQTTTPAPAVAPKLDPIKIDWPPTAEAGAEEKSASPIQLDEIDLDIPTFLRRHRGSQSE
jgi:cell division protein FtsZ